VLLGLTLGGVLIAHAGLQIARAFPPEVRASAVDAIKKRPRIAAVTAAIAAWTLVYALYSLAYPSGAAFLGAAPANTTESIAASQSSEPDTAAPIADNRELLPPSIGGELALAPDAFATVTPEPAPTPTTTTPPPTDNGAPPSQPPPPPEPEPCPAEAVANALGPQAVEILCPGSTP
jgi:hypothetical protein